MSSPLSLEDLMKMADKIESWQHTISENTTRYTGETYPRFWSFKLLRFDIERIDKGGEFDYISSLSYGPEKMAEVKGDEARQLFDYVKVKMDKEVKEKEMREMKRSGELKQAMADWWVRGSPDLTTEALVKVGKMRAALGGDSRATPFSLEEVMKMTQDVAWKPNRIVGPSYHKIKYSWGEVVEYNTNREINYFSGKLKLKEIGTVKIEVHKTNINFKEPKVEVEFYGCWINHKGNKVGYLTGDEAKALFDYIGPRMAELAKEREEKARLERIEALKRHVLGDKK